MKPDKLTQPDKPTQPEQLTPGRLLRINQFIPFFLPMAKSVFWAGVKAQKYPQPIKLSNRITCWRSEDILMLMGNKPQEECHSQPTIN